MTEKRIYHLDTCEKNYYYSNGTDGSTNKSNNKLNNKSNKTMGIIFDNGSFNGRAGWSVNEQSNLVFPNLVRKTKRNQINNKETLIGNEIPYATDYTKYLIKSAFYNDVVMDFETQENVMDYVFKNLNVQSSECVDYPVLMTETFGNPASARKFMSELLFEKYAVKSLCYGVDSLFAFNAMCKHAAKESPPNALILSLSHSCIHLIPRIDGVFQYERAKRLEFGGKTIHRYLSDLIALNSPTESYQMFPNRIYDVTHQFTQLTSMEYFETLDNIFKDDINATSIYLQLPEPTTGLDTTSYAANDPQDKEQQTNGDDSKKKNINFYKQMHAHHNSNRLIKIQSLKSEITTLEEAIQDNDEHENDSTLKNRLEVKFKKCNSQLDEIIHKYQQSEDFLNDTITLEQLLASSTKNRLTLEEVTQLQQERLELIEKRDNRAKRKKELTKRKGHAVRERMKKLNKLDDFDDGDDNKKPNDSTKSSKKQVYEVDSFGMNDDDWDVYRGLNFNQESDNDSETENERITQIENKLAKAKQPIEQQSSNGKIAEDIENMYRIRLTTEPYRIGELLYKPYIAGLTKQNGLSECIEQLLRQFSDEEQTQMCKNIYVTGGVSNIKNFESRLCAEFQCLRPFESESNIMMTHNAMMDSWNGAQQWFNSSTDDIIKNYFTTNEHYEEYGLDYPELLLYRMHPFSNMYSS